MRARMTTDHELKRADCTFITLFDLSKAQLAKIALTLSRLHTTTLQQDLMTRPLRGRPCDSAVRKQSTIPTQEHRRLRAASHKSVAWTTTSSRTSLTFVNRHPASTVPFNVITLRGKRYDRVTCTTSVLGEIVATVLMIGSLSSAAIHLGVSIVSAHHHLRH